MKDKLPRYRYGFWSRNRGLQLSILLPLGIFGWIVFADISTESTPNSTAILILGWSVFAVLHIIWDFRIKKTLFGLDIENEVLVFYLTEENESRIPIKDIEKIELFPSEKNIYDNDFIANMMSSGMRIFGNGKAFLVFSKVKHYKEIQNILKTRISV